LAQSPEDPLIGLLQGSNPQKVYPRKSIRQKTKKTMPNKIVKVKYFTLNISRWYNAQAPES
jgi:hypothetical protein